MLSFWVRFVHRDSHQVRSLVGTYQAISSASVDALWQKVVNLADVSWHPLLASTNVPKGLIPKPGLIYQAVTRRFPIPIQIFVERVSPRELLSVRVLAIPGVEERVTYKVESTLCGTRVSVVVYSPLRFQSRSGTGPCGRTRNSGDAKQLPFWDNHLLYCS
jgi:hypothetical protein